MRPIQGYDGKYLVDESGNVFTVERQGTDSRKLVQSLNSSGYLRVSLRKGSQKKSLLVHRIVAEAFIPNPENKKCVNHIDGNKLNNSANNLEWCTHSENMKHAVKNKLSRVPTLCGEAHPCSKLTEKDVKEILASKDNCETASAVGKKYGVTKEQIYNIWKHKQWRCLT